MFPNFFKKLGPITFKHIQSVIDCDPLNIEESDTFEDLLNIDSVKNNSLSFMYDNEKQLKKDFPLSSGIVCTEKTAKILNSKQKAIIVKNVQEAVAKISNIFYRDLNRKEKDRLDSPQIGENCDIGDNVTIENGAIIGNNVSIRHNTIIKHNCIVGNETIIGSNSVISNTILGENVYIGNNSSLGQRGFGFYLKNNNNIKIYHKGRVVVYTNASIGSGCTIDRGSFSDTIIGKNTYLDNLCHIAHNVEIGNNCAFAAMTGVAGSTKIGNNVLTGGQAGIAGHITIGNNVQIAAKSGVFYSLEDGATVMGNPAINKYTFIKKYKKIYGT